MVRLDDTVVSQLQIAKKHGEGGIKVNSIDFVNDGTTFIAAFSDDSVGIYDLKTGQRDRAQVNSKKYGVGLIRYTHSANSAVHSSTKVDNTIRYLSLYDNKYLRYFIGHTAQVTALSMSPIDDNFLSASLDKTIRLWDLRSNSCQGLMQVQGRPVTSFDPEGLIFAAGINSEVVKLYDLRSFDKGPFTNFKVDKDAGAAGEWTGMEFSPDGKLILLNTNSDYVKVLDAFHGTTKQVLRGHKNDQKIEIEASFTPDSQYVLCGSADGHIYIYSAETGRISAKLPSDQAGLVRFARFNPKFCMMVTADTNICFWLPPEDVQQ